MKKFVLIVTLLLSACTPITLIIPPDPELPRVNFILDDVQKKDAAACLDSDGLKTLYERELILKGHINILKEQVKRCND